MVEAEVLNRRGIEGVKVTRGLEGHVKSLLKVIKLKEEEECPICLSKIPVG